MACFLAPAAEAIVVTAAKKVIEKKEKNQVKTDVESTNNLINEESKGIPLSKKIGWLSNMLWGGSFLLLIEHIWHGEIVPWAPFLTAMGSPEDTAEMLKEIAAAGTAMALLITAVWAVMAAVVRSKEKAVQKEHKTEEKFS
ncbi:MAG: hypothetical protein ACLRZ9_07740 [Eubacterium sp.]